MKSHTVKTRGLSSLLRPVVVAVLLLVPLACSRAQTPQLAETTAHYLTTQDGTRLAVDVHLPAHREPSARLPALIQLTRYWRAGEHPETGAPLPALGALDRFFLGHGYAVVKVDVRGSGASFGTRPVEYGPQEVRDGYDVVAWVVQQPWSDGMAGAYGTSYTGTTAELLAATQHPAVKAVIPGWSDFDIYASPARPYGLLASFIQDWGSLVGAMDRNDAAMLGAHVRRVDGDEDGALIAAATAEHRENPDVYQSAVQAEFRDDVIAGGVSYLEIGPQHWREQIERSGVPMLVLVSWLDAGTTEGALLRFQHIDNPQKLVIMASSHGGGNHASPYTVAGARVAPVPSTPEQFQMRLDFFDRHLKGIENGVDEWPAVRYFNLGEEAFRETEQWPPPGTGARSFYLQDDHHLGEAAPAAAGSDEYEVDFTVSTGANNRWRTQMGEPVLNLNDRAAMDERMLTYTTLPLEDDLQITGTPTVTLLLASDHPDAVLLVYLEDVDGDGRSRYLTEGGLRLIHRKEADDPDYGVSPYHSFARGDASPMEPGVVARVRFRLLPTSVQVRRGHRLRLAIAGADAGTFDRVPAKGTPTLRIHWDAEAPSVLNLPVLVNAER